MDSQTVVKALVEVDPGFVALVDTLYGPTVDAVEVWKFLYAAEPVLKMSPDPSSVHTPGPIKAAGGTLVPKLPPNGAAVPPAVSTTPPLKKATSPRAMGVLKADEDEGTFGVVWSGEFTKMDTERRQAFGWASVVEVDGEPVVDLQGDWITPDEIEKAAYSYVRSSRVGGTQHARDDEGSPVRAGDLIESIVYTDEKYEALAKSMNVDPSVFDDAPRGWWTGFQYDDNETWADIKAKRKTGFSVHGRGKRQMVELPG